MVVFPTELVSRNGDTLKAMVVGLAQRSGASDAFALVEDCVFATLLVDRIVSSAIEPAGAVAEPYVLWEVGRHRLGLQRHGDVSRLGEFQHAMRSALAAKPALLHAAKGRSRIRDEATV